MASIHDMRDSMIGRRIQPKVSGGSDGQCAGIAQAVSRQPQATALPVSTAAASITANRFRFAIQFDTAILNAPGAKPPQAQGAPAVATTRTRFPIGARGSV